MYSMYIYIHIYIYTYISIYLTISLYMYIKIMSGRTTCNLRFGFSWPLNRWQGQPADCPLDDWTQFTRSSVSVGLWELRGYISRCSRCSRQGNQEPYIMKPSNYGLTSVRSNLLDDFMLGNPSTNMYIWCSNLYTAWTWHFTLPVLNIYIYIDRSNCMVCFLK